MQLVKQLDRHLLNLAWSLWTEIGVAGVVRRHQHVLILLEELILFTSVLSEIDFRLRDEAIDWCSQYHRFISVSRLKSLMPDFEEFAKEPFSQFAATLNELTNTNWPVFISATAWKINLSCKSVLRPLASAALLNIRARSIFGAGSRADLVTFLCVHPNEDFSVAETTEIGYSKRNLAEVFDDLHFGHLFEKFMQGNQQRYRLKENSPLIQMLQPIPKYEPWRLVFKVLLTLKACIQRTESSSESTKGIEIQNCLIKLEVPLQKLGLIPPSFQNSFPVYLESFSQWILAWVAHLAEGK